LATCLYLDISKAFDLAWHEFLILNLFSRNIPGNAQRMPASCVENCTFYLSKNATISATNLIWCLSGRRSLFYTFLDIHELHSRCLILSSAYPLMTLYGWSQITASRIALQKLCPISLLVLWRICINLHKTVPELFTRRSRRQRTWINLIQPLNSVVNECEVTSNYTSDRKLLWNEHINNIANKTSARISVFVSSVTTTSHSALNSTCVRIGLTSYLKVNTVNRKIQI
jgi:hypothetical protein